MNSTSHFLGSDSGSSTLHTGGAPGADSVWAQRAYVTSHHVKVFSFDGHKRTRLVDDQGHHELIMLDKGSEQLCNMALEQTAIHVNKKLHATGYERHLLERDYNMVREAQALYAVGHFLEHTEHDSRLRIAGHTSWTTELFLDILLARDPTIHDDNVMLPVYFFSQDTSKWYQLHHTSMDNFRWVHIDSDKVTKPHGNYVGIGSRELTNVGTNAIMKL
jgi:hypothetical protein